LQVLIVDNNNEKIEDVKQFLINTLRVNEAEIFVAKYIAEFNETIQFTQFDLIILDLRMKFIAGGDERHTGLEAVNLLASCDKQKSAQIVALTAYEELFKEHRLAYDKYGVLLLQYDHTEFWKNGIEQVVRRIAGKHHYDFVILCALEDEAQPFSKTELKIGDTKFLMGLNLTDVTLNSSRGALVVLPEMGSTITSVITTRILECFTPKVICMSGICAGFPENVQLGQMIVADPCWDYQSGKVTPKGLKLASYQVRLNDEVKVLLDVLNKQEDLKAYLHDGLEQMGSFPRLPCCISPLVTGSPVVADKDVMAEILEQHRKVAGLDMEIYGFYRAVKFANTNAKYFAAKCVVDIGDNDKNDDIRIDASLLAARYTVRAIDLLLQ